MIRISKNILAAFLLLFQQNARTDSGNKFITFVQLAYQVTRIDRGFGAVLDVV